MTIDMTTKTGGYYAVIGHPITHSLSPAIHNALAASCGIDLSYDSIDALAAEFYDAVAAFAEDGGTGLNVTLPHKYAAWRLASTSSEQANLAQAANTLIRRDHGWHAENTDGTGLMRHLRLLGIDVQGLDILVLGAGGAARGVMGHLLEAKPNSIDICNRTRDKAMKLAQNFAAVGSITVRHQWPPIGDKSYGLVINATAAWLNGGGIVLPSSLIASGGYCYDLCYDNNADTPFVAWGKKTGANITSDGLGMLIEQAAASFTLWHKVAPDTAPIHRQFGDRAT